MKSAILKNSNLATAKQTNELLQIWQKISKNLKKSLGDEIFDSWIKDLEPISYDGFDLAMRAPTRFIRDWINSHYIDDIKRCWLSEKVNVRAISINVDRIQSDKIQKNIKNTSGINFKVEQTGYSSFKDYADKELALYLDRKLTFETFITGASNQMAYLASKQIIKDSNLSPLFIYGNVGLGKTHLLNALSWEIKNKYPNSKIFFISAEKFMYMFIKSLKLRDTISFKRIFRNLDVLIIDDIQFMSGKPSTQEEFLHTINYLIEGNKKIIISSDRSPADLKDIDKRIRSRLSSGTVTDIVVADYYLRLKILKNKSKSPYINSKGAPIPNEVLEYIARNVSFNIRELEGSLKRILTFSSLANTSIYLSTTREVLKDLLRIQPRKITVDFIQQKVGNYFGVTVNEINSTRRLKSVVRPRQVAMYFSKILTSYSLPQIGKCFGGRDHTTVIHAIRKIKKLEETDAAFKEQLSQLKLHIEN